LIEVSGRKPQGSVLADDDASLRGATFRTWNCSGEETSKMRGTLLAVVAAAGIGLAGAGGASAAPINGLAIGQAADATNQVETVQHWRWGSRGGHWRWGSRGGHYRWGSRGFRRCHGPYSSRWWRC
jgi:hypothetical protein